MKVTYCYNENYACKMRGSESDHPNITETITVKTTRQAAMRIACDVFECDEEDAKDMLGTVSLDNLISYADDVDITGGDPILFWVQVDQNPRLETSWDEDEFECEDEDNFDDDDECDDEDAEMHKDGTVCLCDVMDCPSMVNLGPVTAKQACKVLTSGGTGVCYDYYDDWKSPEEWTELFQKALQISVHS